MRKTLGSLVTQLNETDNSRRELREPEVTASFLQSSLAGVRAHQLLLQLLSANVPASPLQAMEARIDLHLALPRTEKEAGAEALFAELARFTADALSE